MEQAEMNATAEEPLVEMARRLNGLWDRAVRIEDMAHDLAKGTDQRRALERAGESAWAEVFALHDTYCPFPATPWPEPPFTSCWRAV